MCMKAGVPARPARGPCQETHYGSAAALNYVFLTTAQATTATNTFATSTFLYTSGGTTAW